MMIDTSRLLKLILVVPMLLCSLFLMSCSSGFQTVMPNPPEKFETVGNADGSGTGTLWIDGTAYNFIPIALNGRVERAYQDAVESVPGATMLTDVTYQESWFWFILGTARTVSITGKGIKEVK